jgi:hypothetical protein
MSLARLLAAGKSVVGISNSDTRYRMNAKRLLPKFGARKNPFLGNPKRTAQTERETEPQPKEESEQNVEPSRRIEAIEPGEAPQTQVCPPSAGSDSLASKSSTSAPKRGFQARLGSAKERLARLAKWPGTKARGSPFGPRAVQSELQLDMVKVVRNDLSSAPDDLFGRRALSGRFESEPLADGIFRPAGAAGTAVGENASPPGADAPRRRRFFGLFPSHGAAGAEVESTKPGT